jgi:hypothetical protein
MVRFVHMALSFGDNLGTKLPCHLPSFGHDVHFLQDSWYV